MGRDTRIGPAGTGPRSDAQADPAGRAAAGGQGARADRLAAALRANLGRRKARARARAGAGDGDGGEGDGGEGAGAAPGDNDNDNNKD